jgi:D-amino-acid dehydrogenase
MTDATPPSTASRRAIVISSGVIGTATAHYLVRSGWKVTLIERGELGSGSSHANCGLVCPSHILPLAEPGMVIKALKSLLQPNSPFRIKVRLDPALWSWMLHFAARCNGRDMIEAAHGIHALLDSSFTLYRQLMNDEQLECEFESRGLLFAFKSPAAMDEYVATNELMSHTFQCAAKRFDGEALIELEPALKPGLAGGWFYHDDAHLRPDKLLSAWRAQLESEGANFISNCSFNAFVSKNGRAVAALTEKGEFEAEMFVVATGAWTPLLNRQLGCRIPIQPGKGYSLTMHRPDICPSIPLIFPETRVAVTPFQSSYRLGSTMEFVGYDDSIPPERLKMLRDGASPYLREPWCEPELEQWYGWRPMTYDSLPIIDRSPAFSNVIIAAGHNMLGLSMAPSTGKIVAEIANDERPHIDPAPYRLSRF